MGEHFEILGRVPLFEGLDEATLEAIGADGEPIVIPHGETICRRGEMGTHLYIVLSGRVQVVISGNRCDAPPTPLATHGPGGFFGEMSLLTGNPISADVIASEETRLLQLDKRQFEAIFHQHPSVLLRLNRVLADHLLATNTMVRPPRSSRLNAIHHSGRALDHYPVALHVAGLAVRQTRRDVLLIDLGGNCRSRLERLGLVSQRDPMELFETDRPRSTVRDFRPYCVTLGDRLDVLAFTEPLCRWPDVDLTQLQHIHDMVRRVYGAVLLDMGHEVNDRVMKVLGKCDRVFLLAGDESGPKDLARLIDRMGLTPSQKMTRLRVGLIGRFDFERPSAALAPLVEATGVKQAFLLNSEQLQSLSLDGDRLPVVDRDSPTGRRLGALAREVAGVRVGLALGSGGAKGFSHIGVMRVLEEAGIDVDVIVGCSMGAIVGACFALGRDSYETETMGRQLWARKGAFFDWQIPPWCNIVKGRKVDRMGEAGFGDADFLDCTIPYAAMAFDLITGQEVVINEGSLRLATRASGSMPGIMRPIKWRGMYLVDGGVANQVPVDVLSRMGTDLSIAVNVAPQIDPSFYDANHPRMPGILGKLLGVFSREWREMYREPHIIQILARSYSTAATKMTEAHLHLADVSLRPNTAGIGTLDFLKLGEAIEVGQACARAHLPEIVDRLEVLRAE